MPWQTCFSLQKSCVGVCVLWKVMFKQSGWGKHKTEEETLENTEFGGSFPFHLIFWTSWDQTNLISDHICVYQGSGLCLNCSQDPYFTLKLFLFHFLVQSLLIFFWRAQNSSMCWHVTFTARASLWWLSNLLFLPTLRLKHIFILSILSVSRH